MSPETLDRRPSFNPESEVTLKGRILWLTKDPELLRQQLEGRNIDFAPQEELADKVSTDEIIPSRYCFYFTEEELGEFTLTGFRGDVIKPGDVKRGNFDLVIAGPSFGCGSSREHAPISLKGAGINFVAATPIERIFLANSQNQGLYPIENQRTLEELLETRRINREKIGASYDLISQDIIRFGGLLPYLKARMESRVSVPEIKTPSHPMTMVEKIIAAHMVTDGKIGVEAVKPGDAGFVKADFMYGYELSTPLGETALVEAFGKNYKIIQPELIALFEDHTALLEAKTLEMQRQVLKLISAQRQFAQKYSIQRYPPNSGICHNVVVENHALPGQVILGTDSHTCSAGVVGALANGIGATEMAGAFLTNDARITVPTTLRFNFKNQLKEGVMAKDIMLYILAHEKVKNGGAVGRIFEYGGESLNNLSFDELFVLPNMAVEGGAYIGIVEPNEVILNYLLSQHPKIGSRELESITQKSDEGAEFEEVFEISLADIPFMVATPGDPRNGVPLEEVYDTKTDVVYIGSCTGGKLEDLKIVAQILEGRKVKVPTYAQASSLTIRSKAEKMGLISIIKESGATIIDSGCGDCCNLGFGITEPGGTVVSDTNRNFPGRMGNNNVFLVSPAVAAASAIAGKLTTPLGNL